jgi:hypothetical protein
MVASRNQRASQSSSPRVAAGVTEGRRLDCEHSSDKVLNDGIETKVALVNCTSLALLFISACLPVGVYAFRSTVLACSSPLHLGLPPPQPSLSNPNELSVACSLPAAGSNCPVDSG